jgi:hypothetical protein
VRGATIAAAGRQRLGCRAQGAEVSPPHPAAPKPREAEITRCIRRLEFAEETMIEAAADGVTIDRRGGLPVEVILMIHPKVLADELVRGGAPQAPVAIAAE